MHEYHIVEAVVKQAVLAAESNNAAKITRIALVMGELSGLEEGSIRLYFEDLTKGTLAENAELVVSSERARLKCEKCDKTFEYEKSKFNCPLCGEQAIATEKGKGLYIRDIEIQE
ncbi:MAG: hydrogenase maturation nickel metallochaperone HypA [Candidatus Tantalella remota]|nr:hydrogenase maturation nickel metallochaperone HypA [Candidatus Tantalella remota]